MRGECQRGSVVEDRDSRRSETQNDRNCQQSKEKSCGSLFEIPFRDMTRYLHPLL